MSSFVELECPSFKCGPCRLAVVVVEVRWWGLGEEGLCDCGLWGQAVVVWGFIFFHVRFPTNYILDSFRCIHVDFLLIYFLEL